MFASKILNFYKSLKILTPLPEGVEVMNPYQNEYAFSVCSKFYSKYYNDHNERKMILGINPGRFGGGITGVPFTDPIKLETYCGIESNFQKKPELSADFIYSVVRAFGGPEKFYGSYYVSALSPLGFTKDGKNLNYYDIRELQQAVEPFMVSCIENQLRFGIDRKVAFCLGEGENYRYLKKLNDKHKFFEYIIPLPHPRFIMQYKRKKIDTYIEKYLDELKNPKL